MTDSSSDKENSSFNRNTNGGEVTTNSSASKGLAVLGSEVKPMAKRYAIKYNPPSVVLEYKDATKVRLRTVRYVC